MPDFHDASRGFHDGWRGLDDGNPAVPTGRRGIDDDRPDLAKVSPSSGQGNPAAGKGWSGVGDGRPGLAGSRQPATELRDAFARSGALRMAETTQMRVAPAASMASKVCKFTPPMVNHGTVACGETGCKLTEAQTLGVKILDQVQLLEMCKYRKRAHRDSNWSTFYDS